MLEEITKACQTCQRFTPKPQSFKVSFPQDIMFNRELALDLMWIRVKPLLHVVDLGTHFSSAEFVNGRSVEAVWLAFLLCWADVYTGWPDSMRGDQDSVFTSEKWGKYLENYGISFNLSGVESHNSLGVRERYHAPLRRIYEKISFNNESMDPTLVLKIAVKEMNDTMNPEGLVPSLLVFGIPTRFPGVNTISPDQHERKQALALARYEMEIISNELRLQTALLSMIPGASKRNLEVGQKFRVFREDAKPCRWTGPFEIKKIENKQVSIDRNG